MYLPCPHTLPSCSALIPCPNALPSYPVLIPCPHTMSACPALIPCPHASPQSTVFPASVCLPTARSHPPSPPNKRMACHKTLSIEKKNSEIVHLFASIYHECDRCVFATVLMLPKCKSHFSCQILSR